MTNDAPNTWWQTSNSVRLFTVDPFVSPLLLVFLGVKRTGYSVPVAVTAFRMYLHHSRQFQKPQEAQQVEHAFTQNNALAHNSPHPNPPRVIYHDRSSRPLSIPRSYVKEKKEPRPMLKKLIQLHSQKERKKRKSSPEPHSSRLRTI